MSHTVTKWMDGVCTGNEEAMAKLVEHFLEKLVNAGRRWCERKDVPSIIEDQEDAALTALTTFIIRVRDGRIYDLANRYQVWTLLVQITIRKLAGHRAATTAKKRGGKNAVFDSSDETLESLLSELQGPAAAAELNDTIKNALRVVDNDDQKQILLMLMEERSPGEIAEALGVSERTYYREMNKIRERLDKLCT